MTKVSIILPTYNRLSRLKQVLNALEEQDFPHNLIQLVIVSDGSTDGTNEYLLALESVYLVTPVIQANQGAAAARNCGLSHSTGELVLFLDDDVVPVPQLVSEHVKWHETHQDAVVIGPMLTPPDYKTFPWVSWMHQKLAEQYEAMSCSEWQPTARQFYTGNASVPRRHLLAIGGFDPAFTRAEDVELAYRLADRGLLFYFNPRAIGYHYEDRSFASWISIPYAYGGNDIIISLEKGQPWLMKTMIDEFYSRQPIHRIMVRLCLDRSLLSSGCIRWLRGIGKLGSRAGSTILQRFAFSGIFNLRYYQGVSDALGGRRRLLSRIAAANPKSPVHQ